MGLERASRVRATFPSQVISPDTRSSGIDCHIEKHVRDDPAAVHIMLLGSGPSGHVRVHLAKSSPTKCDGQCTTVRLQASVF